MKILLTLILLIISANFVQAQRNSAEADFNKNIKKYTREKFGVGEDASSGWDYLVYKTGAKVVKIRVIHTTCCADPEVADYYFQNDALVLYVKSTIPKKRYKSFANGSNLPLAALKKLYFKDEKLVEWLEKGKAMPADNPNWAEEEKDALESAKSELSENGEMKSEK